MPSGSANMQPAGLTLRCATPSPREALRQKSSAASRPTRWTMREIIPAPARPGSRAGVLEERDVGAGGALLVGVEQVVDARVVLVDRLLDQPQTQHARVEVDVARASPVIRVMWWMPSIARIALTWPSRVPGSLCRGG